MSFSTFLAGVMSNGSVIAVNVPGLLVPWTFTGIANSAGSIELELVSFIPKPGEIEIEPLGSTVDLSDEEREVLRNSGVRLSGDCDNNIWKPTITVALETAELWPPNGKMVQVARISAIDSCDPEPTIEVGVVSNEPVQKGQQDWEIVRNDDRSIDVFLRAKRDGNGTGRVYDICCSNR